MKKIKYYSFFLFFFLILFFYYYSLPIKKKILNNVLITGGCGFIGSHLAEYFERDENVDYVYILDDLSNGSKENIKNFKKVILFIGSVENEDLISIIMSKNINVVFHLAAKISVLESFRDPVSYLKINLIGTLLLLKYSKIYKITSFILSSSSSIYNSKSSPYSKSKLDCEYFLFKYQKYFKTISLRYFNVYGERQSLRYSPVVGRMIDDSLKGKNIMITGNGEQSRDFIYVKDVIYANIQSMNNLTSGIYDVGLSKGISILNLAKLILSLTQSKSKIIFERKRKGEAFRSISNFTNFNFSWNLEDGIKKTIEFYLKS